MRLAVAPDDSPGSAPSTGSRRSTTGISVEGQPSGSPCGYEDDEAVRPMGSAAS